MIARAGYPMVADIIDRDLLAGKLKEVEAAIEDLAAKDSRSLGPKEFPRQQT